MSTDINITVGDNALLDRAKQQQSANRQAQLNRENSTRLEAQATDERTKALAAQGKDANGNPLYGVSSAIPQIDRRPAANRQGDLSVLLLLADEFKDISKYKHNIVNQGATLSNFYKYGTKSFYFPGDQGAFQKITAQLDKPTRLLKYTLPIADADFTVEMWVNYQRYPNRPVETAAFWPTFMKFPGTDFSLDIFEGYFDIWINGLPVVGETTNGIAVPDNFLAHQTFFDAEDWTHLVAMRIEGAVTLFVNGIPSLTSFMFSYSIPAGLWEFGSWSVVNFEYKGWLDDIRISHGAKYPVEGFTPPTRALPRP